MRPPEFRKAAKSFSACLAVDSSTPPRMVFHHPIGHNLSQGTGISRYCGKSRACLGLVGTTAESRQSKVFVGMNAIVVTFDHLALSLLGCYGNSWVETPSFNRLAARSTVFEQHFAEHLGSTANNHAWWTGVNQLLRNPAELQKTQPFTETLRAAGIQTHLITEADASLGMQTSPGFDECVTVNGETATEVPPKSGTSRREFNALVDSAAEFLQRDPPNEAERAGRLLWLKSAGVPRPWRLAPSPFLAMYLDDEGEHLGLRKRRLNQRLQQINKMLWPDERDSDHTHTPRSPTLDDWQTAMDVYAGYVSYLDEQLGTLLDVVETTTRNQPCLLIVTAAEGDCFGEREIVPTQIPAELSEGTIHTPMIICIYGADGAGQRNQDLTQSIDVVPTLLDWFGVPPADHRSYDGRSLLPMVLRRETSAREYIVLGSSNGGRSIRSRDFYLVQNPADEDNPFSPRTHLYRKPEDLWEISDQHNQVPGEVEVLESQLEAARAVGSAIVAGDAAVDDDNQSSTPN